jgi:hypothetical protein
VQRCGSLADDLEGFHVLSQAQKECLLFGREP